MTGNNQYKNIERCNKKAESLIYTRAGQRPVNQMYPWHKSPERALSFPSITPRQGFELEGMSRFVGRMPYAEVFEAFSLCFVINQVSCETFHCYSLL